MRVWQDIYSTYKKICTRPAGKVDLVTGKQIPRNMSCYSERSFLGSCKKSGKFWEENRENT